MNNLTRDVGKETKSSVAVNKVEVKYRHAWGKLKHCVCNSTQRNNVTFGDKGKKWSQRSVAANDGRSGEILSRLDS